MEKILSSSINFENLNALLNDSCVSKFGKDYSKFADVEKKYLPSLLLTYDEKTNGYNYKHRPIGTMMSKAHKEQFVSLLNSPDITEDDRSVLSNFMKREDVKTFFKN